MADQFRFPGGPYLANIIPIPNARLPEVAPRPGRVPRRRRAPPPRGNYFRAQAAFYRRPVGADPYEHEDAAADPYLWDDEGQRDGGILSLFMHILQFIATVLSGIISLLLLICISILSSILQSIVTFVASFDWDYILSVYLVGWGGSLLLAMAWFGSQPVPSQEDRPVYVLVPEFRRWATASCFSATRVC
ncbi:hypothetical protein BP6252_00214 [Coleophoma cylindrospora]|uniref:Uncharacterized protein n=1 Tax=Coleophoma cylindrospora TaxID=1849047 RepID=A0A3D8SPG0_9HELO|nr:hypothetical protein BP6252_00214 [Coleophoma cylindrospora]